MREIKFRAWDKVSKKYMRPWPDGFHIFGEATCFDFIGMQLAERNPEKTVLEKLDDVEIEQFTGLKDKKRTEEFPEGQEIFEGDIVKFENKPPFTDLSCEVVFDEDVAAFALHNYDISRHTMFYELPDVDYEIIGNIHENPELLK